MSVTRYLLCIGVFMFSLVSCKDNSTEPKADEVKIASSRVETLPYYNDPYFTPKWLNAQSPELKSFHKIPNFKLVNQLGDTVTGDTYKNKIYVADFFFTTCPGICKTMTTSMLDLQKVFKDDKEVMLLSHSVTPTFDSIPVLQDYAEAYSIDASTWHLLTGDRKLIYDLGRNFYYAEEDLGLEKGADDFLHTENFLLIDKNKHIRGIYNGLRKKEIRQLIGDIKALKSE